MRLPKFFGKLKKLKSALVVRRVYGQSMLPTLPEGAIVVGTRWYGALHPGAVVMLHHDGMEKIKRIAHLQQNSIYIVGDNTAVSTDSRHFGPVATEHIFAKVIWPRSLRRRTPSTRY